MAGFFITLEGIEGTGKTTQAARIEEWLQNQGRPCLRTREPGGTAAGESIREILLNADYTLSVETELLLIEAARSQLMDEVILPELDAGKIIILDRFYDSTTAYQGYGRGLNLDFVSRINRFASRQCVPDLTLIFDLDVKTGLERARKIVERANFKDRFESETIEFMERARKGFLEIAASEPNRTRVIPVDSDPETIWEQIKPILEKELK